MPSKINKGVNEMNFGQALELLKKGKKVARQGWNGKHQYIELATNISYTSTNNEVINANHEAIGNNAIAFVGTSGVQIGWLASQADMLANDWVFEKEERQFDCYGNVYLEKKWVDTLSIGDIFNGYQPQTEIERLCLSLMEELKNTEHPYHSILITEDSFKVLEIKQCGMKSE